jgi:hypothetical protein
LVCLLFLGSRNVPQLLQALHFFEKLGSSCVGFFFIEAC